jgi:hypothetical protein
MIRLNRLERIHRRRLRLANHLNLRPAPHARPLRRLQRRVLGRIAPHRRARQHKLDLCRRHERLAVAPRQRVHRVPVDLRQVVADGVHDVLVELLELRRRVQRADVKGQLLRAVEEQLDASQPGLVRLELKPPFYSGLGAGCVVGWEAVCDFRGDFV